MMTNDDEDAQELTTNHDVDVKRRRDAWRREKTIHDDVARWRRETTTYDDGDVGQHATTDDEQTKRNVDEEARNDAKRDSGNARRQRTMTSRDDERQWMTTTISTKCSKKLLLQNQWKSNWPTYLFCQLTILTRTICKVRHTFS